MSEVLHVMAHDSILFLTQDGIARSIKAYQIPEASRTAAGSAITQACLVCLSLMITASACTQTPLQSAGRAQKFQILISMLQK